MSENSALNIPLKKYLKEVKKQVNLLWEHPNFIKWRKDEKVEPGDLIVINNSFLLRNDKSTSKNERYIGLKIIDEKIYEVTIVKWDKKITSDFHKISKKSKELYKLIQIEEEINEQFEKLGKLIFILVGKKISEDEVEIKINHHQSLKKITWNSSIDKPFILQNANLSFKDPYSNDFLSSLYNFLTDNGIDSVNNKELSKEIEKSVKFLKKEAKTNLKIPENNDLKEETLLSRLYKSLDSELELYKELTENIDHNMNEILRISYNFLGDGIRLFRLISSICDLKPLILWGTIYFHFIQNQKLMKIPSLIPGRKVDLKYYDRMIKDARNNRFHTITDFKRTLQFNLPEDAIQASTLTIFSDSTKKRTNANKLNYKDKKIVDLLTEFYRVEEIILSNDFWEKNYEVMKATSDIFKATSEILRILLQKE